MSNDESIEKASDQQQNLPAAAQDAGLAKQDQGKPAIPMLDDTVPDDQVRAFATHSRHVQNHLGGQLATTFYGVIGPDGRRSGDHSGGHIDTDYAGRRILQHIAPRDLLETMLASQLIATHNMAMDCTTSAMIQGQVFQAKMEYMNQANKLSRTYAALLQALDNHRGASRGKKTSIGTVNVSDNAQAVVGDVSHGSGPDGKKPE